MAISSCLSILPLGANQDAPVAGVEAPRALPSRVAAFAAQGARFVKTGVDVSASAAALAAKLCVIPSLGFAIATWFDYFARNNGFHERSLLPSQQFLSCAKQLTAVGLPLLGFELPENSREMSNASAPASSLTLPKCSSEVIDETIELNKWAMRNRAEQRELIDLHRAGLVLGTAALASLCVVTLDLIKSVLRKRAERSLPGAASHDLASGGTPTFLQDLKNTIDLQATTGKMFLGRSHCYVGFTDRGWGGWCSECS